MTSYRVGGLAVALGIGSAVVVGTGVAAAEPAADGPAKPAAEASDTAQDADRDTSKSPSPAATGSPDSANAGDAGESAGSKPDLDDDSDAPPPRKKGSRGVAAQVTETRTARTVEAQSTVADSGAVDDAPTGKPRVLKEFKESASTPAPVTSSVASSVGSAAASVNEPLQKTPVAKPDPIEQASVALAKTVSSFLNPFAGGGPSTPPPIASPVLWTMAAASRREIGSQTTELAPPADEVANSLTVDSAAADTPTVVAIEQKAPLEWLQHIPIFGPAVVTPIVTAIHMLPVVGDVLHAYVGYPVQYGLPAGAPVARDVKVISPDGTEIYVHFMPARGLLAGQTAPTVLSGPGLTLPGATNIDGTILDAALIDFFGMIGVGPLRNAGYNVVTWDPRGEWNSGGNLELNSAEFEGRDMTAIIDWIATQPEVALDAPGDPRLGMVGVSYGGGIQLVTAANDSRVDAIVPSITYNMFDTALYKSQAFRSGWATLLVAGLVLTGADINPRIIPAAIYGALTGTMTSADLDLLQSRNPDVAKITVPTLLIQGMADTIFSQAEADATAQTLLANGVTTKVIWFCGGHGLCANNLFDLRDGALLQLRTLQWLDRYVKGDAGTPTGPQFEWVDQRGRWYSSDTYPVGAGPAIVTSSTGAKTLPLIPFIGSGIPFVPFSLPSPVGVNLHVPAATETTYLVGAPELTMTYSGTGSARHVYAQIIDDRTGLVLAGIVTPIPVTLDGQTHTITIPLEPLSHTLRPGQSVTLQLVGDAGLYARLIPSLGSVTVSDLQLTLPTADPGAVVAIPV